MLITLQFAGQWFPVLNPMMMFDNFLITLAQKRLRIVIYVCKPIECTKSSKF